ncbi:MAG TPA: DUF898 family protein [Devosia sp.]|nr:DUF898 family protein [Devosia sp.]
MGRVEFTGSRHELFAIIVRGYALMLPTIGLYRFWQATWKRRFYWQNTVIDGEPLEYTGTPSQLLIGFFFALAFFLPIYIALFVLSMQDSRYVAWGYAAVAAIVWFLMGYAIYRARDFRLSRTLWRGIRFDQKGSAFAYGIRRFLWSILMVATLGLVYPWMASSLWRYRWRNTWFGDRHFDIAGRWTAFAGPYFATWFLNALTIGSAIAWIAVHRDVQRLGTIVVPGPVGLGYCALCVVVFALTLAGYRTTTVSRLLSTVSLGEASITVRLGFAALLGQFVAYVVGIVLVLLLLALTAAFALGGVYAVAAAHGRPLDAALADLLQSSPLDVALLIAAYLLVLGCFGLLSEVVLGFGWWRLLARGSTISNPDSLRSVRATAEDRALIGQGLADALNVGAY